MKKLFHHHLLAIVLAFGCYTALFAQCIPPAVFAVSGGGTFCLGEPGMEVGLASTQTGVVYQLQLNLADIGESVAGSGNPISFGLQVGVGSYAVLATDTTTLCTEMMTGTVTISTINCMASISDPCVCKNNATTLINGQFDETIKVNAPGNQVWTVLAATGLYAANSPVPPAAPVPVPNGTLLTNIGGNMFELKGIHVDDLGYTLSVTNGAGTTLSIGNACRYPNPSIAAVLSGNYCLFSDPVTLTGTPGDANVVSQGFTINGVPATQFDPGQGIGQYVIEYTVDGGAPKAFGPNDPGCIQKVSTTVNVVTTPSTLNCNNFIFVALNADCTGEVTPDDILEGTYGCYDDYLVELDKTLPLGNGPWVPAILTAADIGKTYQTRLTHLVSGNTCWGSVVVQDNLPPELICEDIYLACPVSNYSLAYLSNVLGISEAYPVVSDCSNFTSSFIDTWFDLPCGAGINGVTDLSGYVRRKWTATDQWGNSTTCLQYLYLRRLHVYDVELPADYSVPCGSNISTDPSVTGAPYFNALGFHWPIDPIAGSCELQTAYVDQPLPGCDGTYHILRTWTIFDFCLPTSFTPPIVNPVYHLQVIAVVDSKGPVFTCPPNTTVSVDPFACCATVDLPDRIIEDNCSRVNNIGGMITTFDPFTNVQTGMYTIGGTLTDFGGNNYWDRDTLGQWGFTACLPIGTQTVVYSAEDDCGNISTCSFKLKVEDLMPPVAICDQLTQVSLGIDGTAVINAATFDDGSFDVCCLAGFKAGRSASSVGSTVEFSCNDAGKTINVFFRATDCSGNTNDCMVQVVVEDKIKPICSAPPNVTVSCEQFDPTLWLYGNAEVLDNCCLDDTKTYLGVEGLTHTASYTLFDTLCNKGTIVRTFRAFDCANNSSQCTQRIVVNYNQKYYIKFPNDTIVNACSGTFNYTEPKFYGEDCELLGVSYEDQVFTVVPDACFKIERNWKIINWCTFNPSLPCINVPNPNPNAISNHPSNLPGPVVSDINPVFDPTNPWRATRIKVTPNPLDTFTNYATQFYNKNANCYTYKQIIKIVDTQDPQVLCPASPVTICDLTTNDAALWNESYWWDNGNQSHDLCEAPADLCITASDACSGANINIEYQLFLDLDGDGVMETVVNSTQLGSQSGGLGWDNILFGNVTGVGQPRQFDARPVPANQKWGFAIQETVDAVAMTKTACVKFNTFQTQEVPNQVNPPVYVTPQLPHGTHKIKWFVTDGCGNETICEYTIIIKDCKAPTVVCLSGLDVNIMPNGMIQLWASDFLQYAEDNCTLTPFLQYGIRKCGTDTGFPVDNNGNPVTSVTFTCDELATQCVEVWAIDLAGNAGYCETTIIIEDNNNSCSAKVTLSGALKTEPAGNEEGIEAAVVELSVQDPLTGINAYNDLTGDNGLYTFGNVPVGANVVLTPTKDDNPLNGVTTYDLVLISKHILGIEPLSSPYKMIAADANKSNSITTFDIVEIRKLILGIYQEFPNNTAWRFVDKTHVFVNPMNPFVPSLPENKSIPNIQASFLDLDFVGIKTGDVNNTVIANSLVAADDRAVGILMMDVIDRDVKAGEVFEVAFHAAMRTQGYQMTLCLKGLEVSEIVADDKVSAGNFGVFNDLANGQRNVLTVSINDADRFTVRFRATNPGRLSAMLGVSSQITTSEAYSLADERLDIALRFKSSATTIVSGVGFELYQNQPNPFVNKTVIGFHLPATTAATLTVYDEIGRVIFTQKGDYAKGYNAITLDRALLNTPGMLYYTLETATDAATKKMIQTP